ncbi:MAG: right-handed parallel beta-helix repeat-containing protein [Clostridiales bacterium]|nr:right-handed parallel beta-helix repeat-containing protein [Clostridiales bacterium]
MAEICLNDFRAADDCETFARAMAYCREHPGTTLTVPPGIYRITSPLARETMEHVLNGDFGPNPQRTMFNPLFAYARGIDFFGQRGTVLDARGVTFLVDGFMEPLSLRDCENVTIRGLTIDHLRKPYSRGTVRMTDPSEVTAEIAFDADTPVCEKTPLTLRYIFVGPDGRRLPVGIRALRVTDPTHAAVTLSEPVLDGTRFCTIHTYHFRPAILIERAKGIRLEDVSIHSQPGMGIVGNRSENVTLTRLRVVPGVGEMWSSNTDATHFTSMKGRLRFENCDFEGQGDDFTNVHGYYQAVVRRESDTVVYLQEKTPDGTHAQSLDYPDPGDLLELTSHDTLRVRDTFRVIACEPLPEEWMCRVALDHAVPADTDGWMFADVTRLPDLEVIGCHASSHFARSILIKTRAARIEGNTFRDVQGPAIVAAAESWWYEGVCPANVVIRGNRIVNCGWAWGEAAGIVVKADADHPEGQSIRNIVIEDNEIDAPGQQHAIFCRNVDGLTVARNHVNVAGEPVIIEDCTNVENMP